MQERVVETVEQLNRWCVAFTTVRTPVGTTYRWRFVRNSWQVPVVIDQSNTRDECKRGVDRSIGELCRRYSSTSMP